jgi:hypothetical protein
MKRNICHRKTGFMISNRNSFSKFLSTFLRTYFLHSCVCTVTECSVAGMAVAATPCHLGNSSYMLGSRGCYSSSSCVLRAYWTVRYVFIIVDISVHRILIKYGRVSEKSNLNRHGRRSVQQTIVFFFFNLHLLLSTRVLPPGYATGYLQCVYLL